MAFFGLTHLGYQNPIRDNMLRNPSRGPSSSQESGAESHQSQFQPVQEGKGQLSSVRSQHLPYSSDTHCGSQFRYREMVKRAQIPRPPNQLYCTPLTDSQQYGWQISKDVSPPSWTQTKHFPQTHSEMTKFVEEMLLTDRMFSLF